MVAQFRFEKLVFDSAGRRVFGHLGVLVVAPVAAQVPQGLIDGHPVQIGWHGTVDVQLASLFPEAHKHVLSQVFHQVLVVYEPANGLADQQIILLE